MASSASYDEMISAQMIALKKAQSTINAGFEEAYDVLREYQNKNAVMKVAEAEEKEKALEAMKTREEELEVREKKVSEMEFAMGLVAKGDGEKNVEVESEGDKCGTRGQRAPYTETRYISKEKADELMAMMTTHEEIVSNAYKAAERLQEATESSKAAAQTDIQSLSPTPKIDAPTSINDAEHIEDLAISPLTLDEPSAQFFTLAPEVRVPTSTAEATATIVNPPVPSANFTTQPLLLNNTPSKQRQTNLEISGMLARRRLINNTPFLQVPNYEEDEVNSQISDTGAEYGGSDLSSEISEKEKEYLAREMEG